MILFEDRAEAGRELGARLKKTRLDSSAIILALPRGGVPVGYEIAVTLRIPLDVYIIRKLGAPRQPELAMGAIAPGGVRVLNQQVIDSLAVDETVLDIVTSREEKELRRRIEAYRGNRGEIDVTGKTVIVTDDGLATGATMRAAVSALKKSNPARLIAAVPVASPDAAEALAAEVDEVISLATPDSFHGVGEWYMDFRQTTDDEVRELLERVRLMGIG